MKHLLIIAACVLAIPTGIRAQAAPVDSLNKDNDFEFRIGGYLLNAERNSSFNNVPKTGTGNVQGVDFLLRGGGVGISGKSIAGTFAGQPDVVSGDVNLLLGVPEFSVMAGYGRRALSSTLGTQPFSFYRAGVLMSFAIGGSGIRATLSGAGYVPQDASTMKIGGEGEGTVIYSPPSLPFFAQFGYRTEVFNTKSGTLTTPEEVRGIRVGVGIQFGGH